MHKHLCLSARLIAALSAVGLLIAGLGPSPSTLSQSLPNLHSDPAYPLPRWEHPAYGMNLYDLLYTHSPDKVSEMQFSWVKLIDHLPNLTTECPHRHHRLLFRIPFPEPDQDWEEWGQQWGIVAAEYRDCIDAYEIGNEPNLAWEWGLGNPDPVATVEVLRIAYTNIKAADPEAIVVSPGVSPTGSVPPEVKDAWDDRRFVRAMYEAGAKPFFDALGVHPFGFKYPPETDPESIYYDPNDPYYPNNPDPVDGLCFRRAEQLRAVMEEFGDTEKQIWATEMGYIMKPPEYCRGTYDWQARWWQVLDPDTHGWYLSRAFEYAAEHWPWMGPMFVFNLDYSRDPGDMGCNPIAWQAIVDKNGTARPGFVHMRWVPKRPFALIKPAAIEVIVLSVDAPPFVLPLTLESIGVSPATWSFEAADPWVTISPTTATIAETGTFSVTVDLAAEGIPAGIYTTTVTLTAQENVFPQAWQAFPTIIPVQAEVPEWFSAVITPPSIFAMVPITNPAPIAVPFTLENTGISPATWSAEAGEPWITVKPATATVDNIATFVATLNLTESYFPGGTLLGFHSTAITLTAQGGNSSRVIPVLGWVYDRLYQTYLPAVLNND
jgi:hypothetical protein